MGPAHSLVVPLEALQEALRMRFDGASGVIPVDDDTMFFVREDGEIELVIKVQPIIDKFKPTLSVAEVKSE